MINKRGLLVVALWIIAFGVIAWINRAPAADLDGNYATQDPVLHAWFDHLASGKGLCCSFADGRTVDDPDVDMAGSHYRVRVDGTWYDVPDDALITEPNRYGKAVVWPAKDYDGKVYIRCFLPGAGA